MSKSRFDYSWPNKQENNEWDNKVKPPSSTWWTIGWTVSQVNESLEKQRLKGKLIPPQKK